MPWNTTSVNAIVNDELILCEECRKWADDVETTIEKH